MFCLKAEYLRKIDFQNCFLDFHVFIRAKLCINIGFCDCINSCSSKNCGRKENKYLKLNELTHVNFWYLIELSECNVCPFQFYVEQSVPKGANKPLYISVTFLL